MNDHSQPAPSADRLGADNLIGGDDRRGSFRALTEAFVSLFVAVLLFRTFAAEGYMISTGSMAPCLLGFHKRVVCPTCQFTFAYGTAYDTDDDPESEEAVEGRTLATCPNCGQIGIDVSEVPRNEGDQLLVNKQAFIYQSPQRWDIVVFRNPAKPTEAYVKRVIALPGERVQIVDGDIIIDGQIARKSFEQQRSTRILVHDHDFSPRQDADYEPHWQVVELAGDEQLGIEPLKWRTSGSAFRLQTGDARRPDNDPIAWVEYHHWLRSGGDHMTTVPLVQWPEEANGGKIPNAGLKYDPNKGEFRVKGALSKDIARRLLALSNDEPFQNAVNELFAASHDVAVTDDYGYNPSSESGPPFVVRDLYVAMNVKFEGGSGEFVIEMTNGATAFSAAFDAMKREVLLFVEPLTPGQQLDSPDADYGRKSEPVASASWPPELGTKGGQIELSIFDKQVMIAVNGVPLIAPWPFEIPDDVPAPRIPVRFGARGLDVRVEHVKLYRDVFYTETRGRHAVSRPYELKDDQYFALGDNSPVSHDSRRWANPVVDRSLFIGKPFLVHLPSKPGKLRMGNFEMKLRLPDWERIRFLK